ncbi:GNAT family N-acetyltransferase [Rapidithrix thailandica]|uniref:GNAT family N-acetyltransferase n=1 Tax=Rapidithrix thailandica TaxID=413964 RepID=A0AAW9RYZ7_9BACT
MTYHISDFKVVIANENHHQYASEICRTMEESAKQRGTGIAKRTEEYVRLKMDEGKAIIALHVETQIFGGFCYIETWEHGKYVANSGLIVNPEFRGAGLAKEIKKKAFELSRKKFPEAKLFGLTTSLAVMKINSELGYKPVTFSELSADEAFWKGCQSCVNYDILSRTGRKHCLCTGMLYDPHEPKKPKARKKRKYHSWKAYERWLRFKRYVLLKFGIVTPVPEREKVFV